MYRESIMDLIGAFNITKRSQFVPTFNDQFLNEKLFQPRGRKMFTEEEALLEMTKRSIAKCFNLGKQADTGSNTPAPPPFVPRSRSINKIPSGKEGQLRPIRIQESTPIGKKQKFDISIQGKQLAYPKTAQYSTYLPGFAKDSTRNVLLISKGDSLQTATTYGIGNNKKLSDATSITDHESLSETTTTLESDHRNVNMVDSDLVVDNLIGNDEDEIKQLLAAILYPNSQVLDELQSKNRHDNCLNKSAAHSQNEITVYDLNENGATGRESVAHNGLSPTLQVSARKVKLTKDISEDMPAWNLKDCRKYLKNTLKRLERSYKRKAKRAKVIGVGRC